ncbi:small ribosomal subunit biogenesis GTPase RsgA [Acaryochloris sp. IP29b_bin.137]|uniref:small ribosomal subunit biogenesis GTPase RsgA n=1 Tax=Acaryochloris sp. IP29b_bin.137 TaxID=2969217 RepID=UPI002637FE61|nr:small ribosomal subunit biogenesis GTPase RsgA [Acaryochloris sp. IP29b_bin.137]
MSTRGRLNRPAPITGTVLAVQANYYRVQLHGEQVYPVQQLLCTRRSRLKKQGQHVMVGDQVVVEEPDWQGQRGAIASILPRQSEIFRPPVANVNQILLMFALAEPKLDPHQLTRFLVTAENTHLPIILCFNKRDLTSYTTQRAWRDRIKRWGYDPVLVSLQTGVGLKTLERRLKQRITVISGLSGVGKSSLIHHFIPEQEVRVGCVSQRWGQGRHTTRHVELFEVGEEAFLADTPGFNQPSVDTILPPQLGHCFPEIRQQLQQSQCQFKDCLHVNEPNCVIRGDWERYPDYLSLLSEVTEAHTKRQMQSASEARTKRKSGKRGKPQDEPKLETKRYRRPSRRQLQQSLQNIDIESLEHLSP